MLLSLYFFTFCTINSLIWCCYKIIFKTYLERCTVNVLTLQENTVLNTLFFFFFCKCQIRSTFERRVGRYSRSSGTTDDEVLGIGSGSKLFGSSESRAVRFAVVERSTGRRGTLSKKETREKSSRNITENIYFFYFEKFVDTTNNVNTVRMQTVNRKV